MTDVFCDDGIRGWLGLTEMMPIAITSLSSKPRPTIICQALSQKCKNHKKFFREDEEGGSSKAVAHDSKTPFSCLTRRSSRYDNKKETAREKEKGMRKWMSLPGYVAPERSFPGDGK